MVAGLGLDYSLLFESSSVPTEFERVSSKGGHLGRESSPHSLSDLICPEEESSLEA